MKHVDHGYDLELIRVLAEIAEAANIARPVHFQHPGDFLLDGVRYHSRPEAACGYCLEYYVPNFTLRPGHTFQVPVGVGKGGDLQTVDFRMGDCFIEYHPPRIHERGKANGRGRNEPQELRMIRGIIKKRGISRRTKDRAYARLRAYLTRRYTEERMKVLSASPVIGDFTLVVLGSPEELYRSIVLPFSTDRVPPLKLFVRDFKRLLREVVDLRKERG